jgi:hypothetical protein
MQRFTLADPLAHISPRWRVTADHCRVLSPGAKSTNAVAGARSTPAPIPAELKPPSFDDSRTPTRRRHNSASASAAHRSLKTPRATSD